MIAKYKEPKGNNENTSNANKNFFSKWKVKKLTEKTENVGINFRFEQACMTNSRAKVSCSETLQIINNYWNNFGWIVLQIAT